MKVDAKSESKWLAADDFEEGQDHILTIQDVSMETVGRGEKAENKYVVHFKEEKKGLTLNAGNRKRIIAMYGDESDDWIGKRVALYLVDTEYEGNPCKGMRIRDKPPSGSGKPASGSTLPMEAVKRLNDLAASDGFQIEDLGQWMSEVGKFHISAADVASTWPKDCMARVKDGVAALKGGWKPTGKHEPIGEEDIPF